MSSKDRPFKYRVQDWDDASLYAYLEDTRLLKSTSILKSQDKDSIFNTLFLKIIFEDTFIFTCTLVFFYNINCYVILSVIDGTKQRQNIFENVVKANK